MGILRLDQPYSFHHFRCRLSPMPSDGGLGWIAGFLKQGAVKEQAFSVWGEPANIELFF